MDEYHEMMARYIYIPLAAVAGAISSLASIKTASMSKADIMLTFIASFSFAIFVTPWIATEWFGIALTNTRAIAGVTYVFGVGSNVILPVLIGYIKRVVGSEGIAK